MLKFHSIRKRMNGEGAVLALIHYTILAFVWYSKESKEDLLQRVARRLGCRTS